MNWDSRKRAGHGVKRFGVTGLCLAIFPNSGWGGVPGEGGEGVPPGNYLGKKIDAGISEMAEVFRRK